MARRLKLKRFGLQNVNYQFLGAHRLRVEVSDPELSGADPNVFLYQRNLPNPYNGTVTDIFLAITSPVDLAEYPVGEPDGQTTYPFFRLAYVELDFRTGQLAQEVWLTIVNEVGGLLQALDRLEQLVATEEVWVGAGGGGGGGEASGSSGSSASSLSV